VALFGINSKACLRPTNFQFWTWDRVSRGRQALLLQCIALLSAMSKAGDGPRLGVCGNGACGKEGDKRCGGCGQVSPCIAWPSRAQYRTCVETRNPTANHLHDPHAPRVFSLAR
jgi:hypothetical protein